MYQFLYDNELETDQREIELQIKVSLYHELGHALIRYFEDEEYFAFTFSDIEEEKVVEEFAKYQIKEYSEVFTSKLDRFIKKTFPGAESMEEAVRPDRIRDDSIRLKTDFDKLINLADRRRMLYKKEEWEKWSTKPSKFIVRDIKVPASDALFVYQQESNQDALVSLTDSGVGIIRIKAVPHNVVEEKYLSLDRNGRRFFKDVFPKLKQYAKEYNEGGDVAENILELVMEFEDMSQEQINKYTNDIMHIDEDGMRFWWFNATLTDTIRIARLDPSVKTLPFKLLDAVEKLDHQYDSDYIEERHISSDEEPELLREHDFLKDFILLRQHFSGDKEKRWEFIQKDFDPAGGDNSKLGNVVYLISVKTQATTKEYYKYKSYRHILFSSGILMSYSPLPETKLITAFYPTPRDIVKDLRDCINVYMVSTGNIDNVDVAVLSKCLDNVLNGRAVSGHEEKFFDLRKKSPER